MDFIIFDLDGTLVDSRGDIAISVNELLSSLGRDPLPTERIFGFIGNGVRMLVERALGSGATADEVDSACERYLRIYRRHLLDTTRPYPGVRQALEVLAAERPLAVLTNKPRTESIAVLEGLGMTRFFGHVVGGDTLSRRKPDSLGVDDLIRRAGADRARTLMVGDSEVDYQTARNAGVCCCLVTYGLGGESMRDLRPEYLIDDLRKLTDIGMWSK